MRCQVTLAAFLQSFCQYLWFVFTFPDLLFLFFYVNYNKCIGDDTKAAARQSLNCIKNKKKLNMAKNDFQYGGWNFYTLQKAAMWHDNDIFSLGDCTLQTWHGSEIVTVNSPSGSTLQCDTWLWDDMPLNLPKRPPYWNFTSGIDYDQITAVDMSFYDSAPVCKILSKSNHPRQKKWRHVDFQDGGSQPSWF